MPKYSFYELYHVDILPDDCNAEAEAYAREFLCPELMVAMGKMRKREITEGYGKITQVSKTGLPEAVFKFQRGICVHAAPLVWIGDKTVIQGSYRFYKPQQEE
jgi:hypothetical protein